MPPSDDRVIPLASFKFYDPGGGDVTLATRACGVYDVIQKTGGLGLYSQDAFGRSKLQTLPGCGLTCAPFVNLKDTRLANYTTSGGSWEERSPATGSPRVYRLVQYDTSNAVQWSARSSFSLDSNPHVAFSLFFADQSPDWNSASFPPYIRFEFGEVGGQARLGIEFGKELGTRFVAYDASTGLWATLLDLPRAPTVADQPNSEALILLRCLRGRIFVSTDGGNDYKSVGYQDGTALTVPSTPFTLRGQGNLTVFGLHQIQYVAGTYTSQQRGIYEPRLGAAATAGHGYLPAGTSFSVTNLSAPTAAAPYVQYRATLTPTTAIGTPFTYYRAPELYTAQVTYGASVQPGTGLPFYSLPWDDTCLSLDIRKPYELDGATCTIRLRKEARTVLSALLPPGTSTKWRKVQVVGGEYLDNLGAFETILFSGYVRTPSTEQQEYNKQFLDIVLDNASIRFKRAKWDDLTIPLTGLTINQALDYVLATEGLDASYRSWATIGDFITIPVAEPESPCFWPKAGETKWETMQKLCRVAGLELGVLDNGTFQTIPLGTALLPIYVYEASPVNDVRYGIQSLRVDRDASESITACLAQGTDAYGNAISAMAIDSAAEQFQFSARFSPWRELEVTDLPGTATYGLLASTAQGTMIEGMWPKIEPQLEAPFNQALGRRQQIQIVGTALSHGVQDGDRHIILGLDHHLEPDINKCKTTIRARTIYQP